MSHRPVADRTGLFGVLPYDTLLLYALMLTYAVSTTLIGAVLVQLVEEFSLPMSRGGVFYSVLNSGGLAGILLSAYAIERLSPRRLTLAAYGGFAVLLAAIALTGTLGGYLATLGVMGLLSKLFDASANASIAQKHVEHKGFYMNLLHCSFGVGSFTGPLLAGMLLERGYGWRSPYLALGAVCIALFAVYLTATSRSRAAGVAVEEEEKPAAFATLMEPQTWVMWLIIFLYCGHQMGMNNWVPAYLQDRFGADTVRAGFGLSVFWLGLIFSRLSCSFLTRKVEEGTLLRVGSALGALFLLAGIWSGSEAGAFVGGAGAGFFTGATIPMVLTLGYVRHPRARGKITMFFYIAVTLGGIVFPWLMGLVGGAFGLDKAMLLNGALLAGLFLLALCIPRRNTGT